MKDDDGRWIIYETPNRKRERVAVPIRALVDNGHGERVEMVIKTRLHAMLWLMDAMECEGDWMGRYKIIKTEGFPPSSVEAEIREHQRLFGGA